ncbi:MAG: hypothetical protein LBV16_08970 [Elusimicrobiota bacterium]|nr:hypothetical protein [Elusimicrobiota bacterium]
MSYQRESNNSTGKGSVTVFKFKNNFFDAETILSKGKSQQPSPKMEKTTTEPKITTQEKSKPIQTIAKTTQENTEGISKSQKIILDAIKKNPAITTKELAIVLGLTMDGAKWNIKALKVKNKIRHIGATKKGVWEIL